VGPAKVFYSRTVSMRTIRHCMQAVQPQLIYLNSFFSPLTRRTLTLRRLGLIPNAKVVLAPRGEFSRGALELKRLRKLAWIETALRLGIYDHILWKASSSYEAVDIQRGLGAIRRLQGRAHCTIAPDIALARQNDGKALRTKARGGARFVFLSRIAPMKNLRFLLEALRRVPSPAVLDICGPIDDPAYWSECQWLMQSTRHAIRYCGVVAPDRVLSTLSQYHFFVLPTLGENFGHAIVEAWAAGCPVIISDKTQWRQLKEKGLGFDVPLDPNRWAELLQRCMDMDEDTYLHMAAAASEHATRITSQHTVEAALRLFAEATGLQVAEDGPVAPQKESQPTLTEAMRS
jgi:glycosyltransferase involved in cell wall biosynthesis